MNRKIIILIACVLFAAQSAAAYAAELSNEDRAGAVVMPSFEKNVPVKSFAKMLCSIHGRSYVILRTDTSKKLVDSVQVAYDKKCGDAHFEHSGERIHLTVALDAEPSLLTYRLPKLQKSKNIRATNTLLTDSQIVETATVVAKELKKIGIRINFAPIYDTGPNVSIIGSRGFSTIISKDAPAEAGVVGTDGAQVEATRKANLFMRSTLATGIIPVAKHFPGHGHAAGDTHKTLETILADLPELPNFISSIEHGVPMMMVGHLVVTDTRTLEQKMLEKREIWESDGQPATLSTRIMTDLLRTKLSYKGIIITDSMAMGALQGQKDRTVRALEAGADIVLIPVDPRAAYSRVVEKMNSDERFAALVTEKANRVLGQLFIW
jgi:beta-N-acetylhexosaminidase